MPSAPSSLAAIRQTFFETGTAPISPPSNWECPICFEGNADEGHSPIQIKACKHIFGTACLKTWAQDKNTCPMCRQELFFKEPTPKPLEFPAMVSLAAIFEQPGVLEGPDITDADVVQEYHSVMERLSLIFEAGLSLEESR
jgi:hypothetical protein